MTPIYLGVLVDDICEDYPLNAHDDCKAYLDVKDDDDGPDIPYGTSEFQPELMVIPLPSNLDLARCKELGLTDLIKEETTLHEGQANDALYVIRVHLGDKAIIFRNMI